MPFEAREHLESLLSICEMKKARPLLIIRPEAAFSALFSVGRINLLACRRVYIADDRSFGSYLFYIIRF